MEVPVSSESKLALSFTVPSKMRPKFRRTPAQLETCSALVLAGGLGTRLRSVFERGPKCMAPVGGRLFLEYLLDWLRSFNIKDLILCVGHKSSQIQNWLGDGGKWGMHVRYSVEEELLGTGGALKLAERMLASELCLVVNGDSFLNVDLQAMHRFHLRRTALATIAVAKVRSSGRYGRVQLDADGKITAFREKDPRERLSRGGFQLINGGVYLLQKRFLDAIPSDRVVSVEKEIFPTLVGKQLYGFITEGYFIDIGIPSDFARAQAELPSRVCT
jgi:NDP-sugar pyrophosphorylase family protein